MEGLIFFARDHSDHKYNANQYINSRPVCLIRILLIVKYGQTFVKIFGKMQTFGSQVAFKKVVSKKIPETLNCMLQFQGGGGGGENG